jgi:hypothetical protein
MTGKATAFAALLVLTLSGVSVPEGEFQPGDQATVKVLNQHMFSQPLFYSQPVGTLSLGQLLTILSEQGDWYEAETATGASGWVHRTALTEESVDLSHSGGGSGSVSAEEITLSGRGFNEDVEAWYRDGNPGLDFDAVDLMEQTMTVEPEELHQFLVEGELIEGSLPSGAGASDESSGGGGR